ncbi:MAG: LacI family transcriptional regulator [Cytophagales bacterium CG18_big_fil_WC_8_21_14_2_50_42_9]|nr:MAG: LacI family transcriptional regulator [Cytophagales bacterium CG18_big_fil_WC_8_21_14_2_50_42_9]
MKKLQNTIKDIAQELNLSPSTVSRALNNHPHISQETKKKVREAVEKLGYRHNAIAASLRNNKSNIVGLIVPRISMFFQSTVVTAIQNKLHEHGYNLMICQSNDSPALEKELVNVLYTSRVEGLIVAATLYTTDFSPFDIFATNNIPLVFYDRLPKNYPTHKIQGDEYRGGYESTTHLLEQGCRRIAHIGGPLTCNLYQDRYQGYQDALREYNIELDEEIVFFHELTKENALHDCLAMWQKGNFPDGIFACNDTTAITIVEFAREYNISIPGELKISGYTNDPRTQIIEPPITSVEQFPYRVGEEAANLMLNLMQHKTEANKDYVAITTPIELVKRKSSLLHE